MSEALDLLLSRLPGHFKKDKDSNNYKLLSLVAKESEDNQLLADTIQKFWDVDHSEGTGLDRLGKDEGLSRGSYDDETYRKLIKIQYVVNLSEGDRESINTILRAYMGDHFLSIQEGWESIFDEPASMLINLSNKVESFPYSLMDRIKPTGVSVYTMVSELVNYLKLSGRAYTFLVNYRVTNRFKTAPVPGAKIDIPLVLSANSYTFNVNYKRCGAFRTGGH
ncbi:DUF2612 domain-containing protein [Heyndrickxia oleronia]|uniref:DUF2612 domain-containing protein n=1 Tax=Heyndrickxia oleronia TaxID=38875 RepID=UPI001C0ED1FB|nr:DUF2612 domain-containing protein [Heyndrickxia oleronia]MBU5214346.1 DUF2612 domain-containing protein [Heyndrickxia oleronia]